MISIQKDQHNSNEELNDILNDPKVDNVATKIQAVFRGRTERAKLEKMQNTKKEEQASMAGILKTEEKEPSKSSPKHQATNQEEKTTVQIQPSLEVREQDK